MTLVILGAILAFAVRVDSPIVNLRIVGVIFMLAGGSIIAYYRREKHQKQVVTRVEETTQGDETPQVVRETVIEESIIEADDKPERHSKPAI